MCHVHDALPRRAQDDVREHLDDERRWLVATADVLPLAQAANVSQQAPERGPVRLGQLVNQAVQLDGALVVARPT